VKKKDISRAYGGGGKTGTGVQITWVKIKILVKYEL
jgi:hypothetical protein